jgi:hypothetical protein
VICFICKCSMLRESVGITIYDNCFYTETARSVDNTDGDFTSIGDKDLVEQGLSSR